MDILHVGVWLGNRPKNWEFRLSHYLGKYNRILQVPYTVLPQSHILANFKPDVILSTHSMCVFQAWMLKKFYKAPWVATILDIPRFRFEEPWASNLTKYYGIQPENYKNEWDKIASALKEADLVVTISKKTRDDLQDLYDVNSQVVYLGVDQELADQYLPKKPEKQEYFTGIGNLVDHKRFDLLVDFFNSHGKAFKLIGEGVMYETLRANAKNGVEILGAVEESVKWNILASSLGLCHASIWEGFLIPASEALYAKVPVIAYELEVLREVYKNEIYYWTNLEELKEQLNFIAENKPEGNRDYIIKNKLTLEDSARRLEKILCSICI
jgi:glycosyltransferase involved in cell wall biosynthesis